MGKGSRGRLWTAGLLFLAVVAGSLLFYLVAANVLLSTGLFRSLVNKNPDKTWIEYRAASSFWPGRLRVKNFRIRDRDLKAEWMFELEDARVSFSVMELFRRRFHATSLRGKGLTFRARNRLDPKEATAARTALLPPIFGFSDPPLLKPGEEKTPRTGKEWTIHLEEAAVLPVREIWVDTYRYNGESKLAGGFFLRPKMRAEVFPSSLEVRNGVLRLEGEPVAEEIRGLLGCVFHPWDPRQWPGKKVLKFLTGEGRLEGKLRNVKLVNQAIGDVPGTRLERGSGALRLETVIERGIARGEIGLTAPAVAMKVLDVRLRGRLEGRANVKRLDLDKGEAQLLSGFIALSDAMVGDAGEKGRPWWGRVDLQGGRLATGSSMRLTSSASVKARDARPLLALLNVKLPDWRKDLLDLEGLTAKARVEVGKSLFEVSSLTATGGQFHIQGEYRAKGVSRRGTFLIDLGPLSVGIGIRGKETEVQILGPKKWYREQTGREPKEK